MDTIEVTISQRVLMDHTARLYKWDGDLGFNHIAFEGAHIECVRSTATTGTSLFTYRALVELIEDLDYQSNFTELRADKKSYRRALARAREAIANYYEVK